MLDKETVVNITNRSASTVSYTVADLDIRRSFAVNETKPVTVDELRRLSFKDGGFKLLQDYLVIDNKELVEELLGSVEPEYWYNVSDVKDLLLNGSLEALEDCLDFAPDGVIDLVKEYAVRLRINDLAKREAIFRATGFNVSNAIQVMIWAQEDAPVEQKETRKRRVAVKEQKAESAPTRRTSAPAVSEFASEPVTEPEPAVIEVKKPTGTVPKYKVVSK